MCKAVNTDQIKNDQGVRNHDVAMVATKGARNVIHRNVDLCAGN